LSEPVASDSAAGDAGRDRVRKVYHEPSEPVDLLSVAGAPLARRMLPPMIAAVLAVILVVLVARRVLAD
jgi:hypothetical protein